MIKREIDSMHKDLTISETKFESMVLIKSWPETSENIASIIINYFELSSLPNVGAVLMHNDIFIASLLPGHYMIISDRQNLHFELSKIITAENAAVIDISHSRRGVHLKGVNASLILNKEIAIDFSNEAMPANTVVQTDIHAIGVILFKFAAEDFLIFSYSSFFKSFYAWLIDATKEYE